MSGLSNIRLKFTGPSGGHGGYGHATRYIARSFSESDVPVFFDVSNKSIKKLSSCYDNFNVNFILSTPSLSRYKDRGYKIGYFYWEADRLPSNWGRVICKALDEIWVPCNLTKKACISAGFSGPIEIVHTPRPDKIQITPVTIPIPRSKRHLDDNAFVFYSVFQWNERKGYKKLLRAYLEEFSSKENVILIIKTDPIKVSGHGMARIKDDILRVKSKVRGKFPPSIFLITDIIEDSLIAGLHDLGDCFVLPHHGEGWGMPIHDAMLHGNMIITTKYGGITEFLDENSAMIIKHKMTEVKPMTWTNLYDSSQMWADPDIGHLKFLMRKSFNIPEKQRLLMTRTARDIASSMTINTFSSKINDIFRQKRFDKLRGER